MEIIFPLEIDAYLESISSKHYTFDVIDAKGHILATTWSLEMAETIQDAIEKKYE